MAQNRFTTKIESASQHVVVIVTDHLNSFWWKAQMVQIAMPLKSLMNQISRKKSPLELPYSKIKVKPPQCFFLQFGNFFQIDIKLYLENETSEFQL